MDKQIMMAMPGYAVRVAPKAEIGDTIRGVRVDHARSEVVGRVVTETIIAGRKVYVIETAPNEVLRYVRRPHVIEIVQRFTPILRRGGLRCHWLMRDAVVVWLYLQRQPSRRWSCAEIAAGLNAESHIYGLEQVTQNRVNAAMSAISIRTRASKFCDDRLSTMDHPDTGLSLRWRNRQWRLTREGVGRARTLLEVRQRKLAHVHARLAQETASGVGD